MRRNGFVVLVGAFAAAALAGQAAAAVVITTYKGTIANGTDVTGVFGAAGANLAGLPFIAIFETDSSAPGAIETFGATSSSITGGGPTPPVTGKITIKGITEFFNGDVGTQTQSDNGTYESFLQFASNHVSDFDYGSLFAGGFGSGINFLPGSDYRTFAGADLSAVPNFFGSMDIFQGDEETDDVFRRAFANLNITSVTVPEPEGWALMILGFGAIGALMRYRRHTPARSSQ
jgi:hypothetical protein